MRGKSVNPSIVIHYDNSGKPSYSFNVSINSYFAWLDRQYETI